GRGPGCPRRGSEPGSTAGINPAARPERSGCCRFLLEPEELAHVAVVLLLAELRAEVEPQLVDDLRAQVREPEPPTPGADSLVNHLAQLVRDRRAGQLAGALALHTPRPLAAEPGVRAGVLDRRGLRLRDRRPDA